MAEITLNNLSKIYAGNVRAVDNVNLEIADREFLVLVGPSGCGKSTTLRMIAGLEEVSEGTISIDGRIVNDVAPKDRDIAMVFQNYALYPHMNVRENLAFGLKLRKFPAAEIDHRVAEAAEMLKLSDMLDRKPKELSGGQRQRVALGKAIVRKPKVFLFDEPLSNLDAKLRNQMRVEISRLHKQLESTMIYVTHDQVEAMTMGTRIVVMKDGVVQQADSPLTLYNKPVNKFVAGFIGSPAMNFIEGELKNGVFEGKSLKIDFSDRISSENDGKMTILGIRPEHLNLSPHTGNSKGWNATLELAEPMGAETHLHLHDGSNSLIARISADSEFKIGESIGISISSNNCRLFDAETGDSLLK